jgi:hypothetical protein
MFQGLEAMAQVILSLSSKLKTLSSNTSIVKQQKQKAKIKQGLGVQYLASKCKALNLSPSARRKKLKGGKREGENCI